MLLLFADALVAPALLADLREFDELMVASSRRFALDIFTIVQQDQPGGRACCWLRKRRGHQPLDVEELVVNIRSEHGYVTIVSRREVAWCLIATWSVRCCMFHLERSAY